MQRLVLMIVLTTLGSIANGLPARAQATQAWVQRFDSAQPPSIDEPAAILVGDDGSVFVTGSAPVGSPTIGAVTFRYSADGAVAWFDEFRGPSLGGGDEGTVLALDSAGNLLVGGRLGVDGPAFPGTDFLVLKYAPNGNLLWVASYDGTAADHDQVTGIAVDSADNVYVVGNSERAEGGVGIAVVKYDSAGNEVWVRRYSGSTDNTLAIGIVLTGGHLYVGGTGTPMGGTADFLLLKYALDGTLVWDRYFDGPDSLSDTAHWLVVDSVGDLLLTGQVERTEFNNTDFGTFKIAADGVETWRRIEDAGEGSFDRAFRVATDADDGVIVTGSASGGSVGNSVFTLKYLADGTPAWDHLEESTIGRPLARGDMLAIDDSGAAYLVAMKSVPERMFDVVTFKLSSSGERLWDRTYGEVGNADDWPISVALGHRGEVYALTMSHHVNTEFDWDYATVQYLQDLFSDGFESGGFDAWTLVVP